MTAMKCHRCGKFWTFTGNPDLFAVIAKFCPMCVPVMLPQMGVTPIPQRRTA